MKKENYEWLVSKLRKAETERDEAVALVDMLVYENVRLRAKMRSITDLDKDSKWDNTDIPDDGDVFPED